MAQSTWAASSDTWGTTHVWANETFSHSATIAGTSGVTDNATATFPVSADITQILLSELHEEDRVTLLNGTLGSALGLTASGVLIIPASGSMSLISTTTDSATHKAVGSATLGANVSTSDSANTVYPSTATFSSVLNNVDDEDKVTLLSVALETNYGITTGSVLKAVGLATLPTSTGVVNNINYPESVSMTTNTSSSSASNFLWNTETESSDIWLVGAKASSTWSENTRVSDTWTTSTEATTTWTDTTEDTTEWDNQ